MYVLSAPAAAVRQAVNRPSPASTAAGAPVAASSTSTKPLLLGNPRAVLP